MPAAGTTVSPARPFARPLVLALLGAGLAFACRTDRPAGPPQTTLTVGLSIPETGERSGVGFIVNALVLEPPLALTWEGRAQARVFDTWTWLAGDLGLKLHLRPGIRFHDGTLLTNTLAADILRDAFVVKHNALSSSVVTVEPQAESEVVIRTTAKEGFLLSDLSTVDLVLPGRPHVGTGPFRYLGDGPPIELRAFDGYRQGRPALDTVKIVEYPTPRAAWAAMMRGESNMLHDVSNEAVEFVEEESAVRIYRFERGYYDALIFNQRHPALAQRAVRQAVSEAVDRPQIVARALRGRGTPAKGPFWPHHWALPASFPFYDFNPARAQTRLDAAGFTMRSSETARMPSRLRFSCLVVEQDQRLQRVAMVLQQQLYNVGIDLDVQLSPSREFGKRLAEGRFDSVLLEPVSFRSSAYVYRMWHSLPLGLAHGYSGADAALELFRHAVQDDDVRRAIAGVQQAMFDDPPAVFIDWTERTRAVSSDFEVQTEPGRDILGTAWLWRPAPLRAVR